MVGGWWYGVAPILTRHTTQDTRHSTHRVLEGTVKACPRRCVAVSEPERGRGCIRSSKLTDKVQRSRCLNAKWLNEGGRGGRDGRDGTSKGKGGSDGNGGSVVNGMPRVGHG